MQQLTLHHYGFLTTSIDLWLAENELVLGKPFRVFDITHIHSQKAKITFVQQKENSVLTELVEPLEENTHLQKMIAKGVTIYHAGYEVAGDDFDATVKAFENNGAHALPIFQSEVFENRRCVFLVTRNLGMIELIEK